MSEDRDRDFWFWLAIFGLLALLVLGAVEGWAEERTSLWTTSRDAAEALMPGSASWWPDVVCYSDLLPGHPPGCYDSQGRKVDFLATKPETPKPAPAIDPWPANPPKGRVYEPFRRSLMWASFPVAWDIYWTAECIDRNPNCREVNPLQPSAEHRAALAGVRAVGAAAIFDWGANHRSPKVRNATKGVRVVWALVHLAVGVHNWQESRKR